MKKGLFILTLLCFSGLMLQAAEQTDVKGAHPYKVDENETISDKISHWSLTPHVGFNYFDGDFNSEKKHAFAIPNAGLDLEYSFTPVWSLGLNYMFDMYNVTGKPGLDNADTLLNGNMHKLALYVSMDFMNLFFPKAKKKIFSLNAIVGGGYAWYKSDKMYFDDYYTDDKGVIHNPTHKRGHTLSYVNADGVVGPDYMKEYAGQFFVQAGLGLEFNLNRTIALGVRATYNYFINDYIDGRGYNYNSNGVASKNNDGIVDVTLNMRFKLMAVSKTHVRNISSLDTWKKQEEFKQAHDTVIIRHDSIIVRERVVETHTEKDQETIYYVYFANNKSNLDDKALITIQQVADRLTEDTTLYAVVTGYCDNTGSNQLNYALGDRRAANVMDELSAEHGVDTARMYAMGLGKLVGHRSTAAYGPNRRAMIRLVDKDTFERMKADLDDKRSHREPEVTAEPEVQTIPLSETARPEQENVYKQRESETITADKATTLSKLARKYYNNTYCWVYIYIANKDRLKNPNDIKPGMELIIPELTAEEMRIYKDASIILYQKHAAKH